MHEQAGEPASTSYRHIHWSVLTSPLVVAVLVGLAAAQPHRSWASLPFYGAAVTTASLLVTPWAVRIGDDGITVWRVLRRTAFVPRSSTFLVLTEPGLKLVDRRNSQRTYRLAWDPWATRHLQHVLANFAYAVVADRDRAFEG